MEAPGKPPGVFVSLGEGLWRPASAVRPAHCPTCGGREPSTHTSCSVPPAWTTQQHAAMRGWNGSDTMGYLRLRQEQVGEWTQRNFGDSPDWQPLLGMVEEMGELAHGYLKQAQGIRGTWEDHEAEIADAVGDVFFYMLDFCRRHGLDFEDCFNTVCERVLARDWKRFPHDGVSA